MTNLEAKREEIAELIARELGLGDLEGLSPTERSRVDRQTQETIEASRIATTEPAGCTEANLRLRGLLTEHHALEALRADEADARLAEEGEVFGREDDA